MLKSLHSRHNEVFLDLLKGQRSALQLRQADLAARLGMSQGTVSKVERGERRLDVIELRAWLGALGIDFMGFMGDLDQQLGDYVGPGFGPRHVRRPVAARRLDRARRD